MRPLAELLSDDPAWPLVESWLAEATNETIVLPADRERGEETLYLLQMTSRSPLGAVALEAGGILVDHGWLRILGSGSERMKGSLTTWNGLVEQSDIEPIENALVVAHDAVGGFFALNGGAFAGEPGDVFYFAPESLEWETTELGYSDFLRFAFGGDLEGFYEGMRWPDWRDDLRGVSPDRGFSLFPPPFTAEGKPVEKASRSLVPMAELWGLYREYARQVGSLPDGGSFRIDVTD